MAVDVVDLAPKLHYNRSWFWRQWCGECLAGILVMPGGGLILGLLHSLTKEASRQKWDSKIPHFSATPHTPNFQLVSVSYFSD